MNPRTRLEHGGADVLRIDAGGEAAGLLPAAGRPAKVSGAMSVTAVIRSSLLDATLPPVPGGR